MARVIETKEFVSPVQADGRRYVETVHVFDNSTEVITMYSDDGTIDREATRTSRKIRIDTEQASRQ